MVTITNMHNRNNKTHLKLILYLPVIYNSFTFELWEVIGFRHVQLVPCMFSVRNFPGMVRLYENESQEYIKRVL